MATVTSVTDEDKSKNYFRGKMCVYQKTETCNTLSRKGKIKFISGSFYDHLLSCVKGADISSGAQKGDGNMTLRTK